MSTRAIALFLGLVLSLAGCGRIETVIAFGATQNGVDPSIVLDPPAKAIKASCAGKLTNDNRLAPPAGLPRPPDGSWLLGRAVPGRTIYLGWVVALEPRLADLKISLVDEARQRGYVVQADSWNKRVLHVSYGGPVDVELTVQPFCRDRLALRYVVTNFAPTPPPQLPTPSAGAAGRDCGVAPADRATLTGEQLPFGLGQGGEPILRIGTDGDLDVYTELVRVAPQQLAEVRDGFLPGLTAAGLVTAAWRGPGLRMGALIGGARVGLLEVQPWCHDVLAVRLSLAPSLDEQPPSASSVRPCNGRDAPGPVADALPHPLIHDGQTLLAERRGQGVTSWVAQSLVPGASAAKGGAAVATRLHAAGREVRPVLAPDGTRAAVADVLGKQVLVVVRPLCLDHVAEQYVEAP
jgi:hypothetical protein